MDAGYVAAQDHAQQIRDSYQALKQGMKSLEPDQDRIEQVIPGSKEHGREINRNVEQSTKNAIAEAEAVLAETLAAPVVPEVAAQWERLGGTV